MDLRGSKGEQALGGGFQVGHLECKADSPAYAAPNFKLVDRIGLFLVKNLESCPAQVKDQRSALIVGPYLRRLEPKSYAVKVSQAVKRLGGQGNT